MLNSRLTQITKTHIFPYTSSDLAMQIILVLFAQVLKCLSEISAAV